MWLRDATKDTLDNAESERPYPSHACTFVRQIGSKGSQRGYKETVSEVGSQEEEVQGKNDSVQ